MNIRNRLSRKFNFSGMTAYFFILFIIEFVRGAFLVSYLPSYASEQLHFSLSVIGLAVSVHYLMDNAVKVFAGYLIDRFSTRIVLFTGILLSIISIMLVVHAQSEWEILTATALLGIGGSPVWLVCLSGVQEECRASQMSMLYLFWMCGLGLGPVVMNFLMDVDDQVVFNILIGMLCACGLLALTAKSARRSGISKLSLAAQLKMLWERIAKTGFLLPSMILQTTAGGLLVPLLSPFATQHIGLSHSELSISLIAGGVSALLILVPAGKWIDRLGGKWFLIGGFGIFALTVFMLTFSNTFIETVFLSMILGASYASLLPAWNAYLSRYVPQDSVGAGWGLISTIEGIGVVAGPALGGWMAERVSASFPFWMAAVIFAGIACYYLFSRTENLIG
ncbi:MFS transporter [Paenibacillus solisilvae]|uniref:MFS transporter n=1 Tax=Paenibacillus solisilvae TaxID=2486751 RepID=A0ABW0VTF8_9BACL